MNDYTQLYRTYILIYLLSSHYSVLYKHSHPIGLAKTVLTLC